ncbi:ECF transporter S component [Tissierella creatinini]|nr:ECF transporter S component [Tissierella creatinini]TJX61959.1 ECF transporter S component [Soehngenia saccharolytica]
MKSIRTKDLTKLGIMSSLVCFATYLFKIPTIGGYTHLGDCMIFISVLILGRKKGALAGGMGAAIADLLGGYMQWVLPTFFIKLGMGLIVGLFAEEKLSKHKYGWLIGAIGGGIFQIIAYTLVKIPLLGWTYALSSLPTLIGQTISGIVIAAVIVSTLLSSSIINKFKEA